MTRVDRCRLIVSPPNSGPWNMAVDDVLLADAAEKGAATLRLYQWSEPTLSLGYFQAYDDRRLHAASLGAAVVRRQTGGGAIVHDRELTYSFALPADHRLARRAEELYSVVHRVFVETLTYLFAAGTSRPTLEIRGDYPQHSRNDEPFLCFRRRARGDVLLVDGRATHKILGSAQRRRRGAILQHGSLLLEASTCAPELPGMCDLAGMDLTYEQLTAILPDQFSAVLDTQLDMSALPADLASTVSETATRKYAAAAWTNRR